MPSGWVRLLILLITLLSGGFLNEASADNSDSRAGHLSLFIEGYHTGGCDLDADGMTGIPDLILASEEGFTQCSFDEYLSVNDDPAQSLALVMGRHPEVFSLYGLKDNLGNLVEAVSCTLSDPSGDHLKATFDSSERPISLKWGEIDLSAVYTGTSTFTFSGTAGGEAVSGKASFSSIPSDFLNDLNGSGAKRDYTDATGFCPDQQTVLQTSVFHLDQVFFGAADAQSSHMILSFILTDEELFPSDNSQSCDCLLRAFVDADEIPHDDDRVRQISGFHLAAAPLMAVCLKLQNLEQLCTNHPEVYRCSDVDMTALRQSIETVSRDLQFLALMANAVFYELAAETPQCSGVVHFSDPNLETAVRNAISKPEDDILPEDMLGLTRLQARYKNIQSLEGLQYATNLIDLDLDHNQVSDLGPLTNLNKLFSLILNYNLVTDLSPIQALPQIDQLELYGNPLNSLTPVSSLTTLTILKVGKCGLASLAGIENLTGLLELDVRENNIGSLDALTNLVNVRFLDVRRTGISNLTPLTGMANLLTLYAHGDKILSVPYQNYITSVAPLEGLKKLNYVGLPGNLVSDLDGLVNNQDFAANDYLSLYSNPLSNNAKNVQIPALRARGVTVDY